jgi:hypothetical protein
VSYLRLHGLEWCCNTAISCSGGQYSHRILWAHHALHAKCHPFPLCKSVVSQRSICTYIDQIFAIDQLASGLGHHLGSNRGFCFVWLQSTCAFHHLHELSSEDRLTLNRWLTALFGSEGISDDLTRYLAQFPQPRPGLKFHLLVRSTNPRCLLRLAPTIVKQSLKAYEMGVIDIEGLRGGLSYFQQEILSFTLPGIIRFLVLEIRQAQYVMTAACLSIHGTDMSSMTVWGLVTPNPHLLPP